MLRSQHSFLPCVFSDVYSSATMLASQAPFSIGESEEYAQRPSPLHWHDSFEIGYVVAGSGYFIIEGRELPFGPGQVHVISNTYRHMAYANTTARFFNVHFHPDLLHDISFPALDGAAQLPFTAGMNRLAPLLPLQDPNTALVVALLKAIQQEHSAGPPYFGLMVKGLLIQIVCLLLRHFLSPEPPDAATLRRQELLMRLRPALHLLEQRLTEPCPLAELAAAASLSPSRFCALFHEAMGNSPVAYRNARRILLAQRALAASDEPVAAIGERSGFATVQQFNRIFRRVTGTTPGAYRAQAKG